MSLLHRRHVATLLFNIEVPELILTAPLKPSTHLAESGRRPEAEEDTGHEHRVRLGSCRRRRRARRRAAAALVCAVVADVLNSPALVATWAAAFAAAAAALIAAVAIARGLVLGVIVDGGAPFGHSIFQRACRSNLRS